MANIYSKLKTNKKMTLSTKDSLILYRKRYITCLICATVMFLFADQNLMSPNLTEMANYFGFSDRERDKKLGGDIALGFFIVGAPFALLIGYLADTMNRCVLLGIVVVLGELACFGTFFVETYQQLYFCRVLTGISIGGSTPIIFSILADYYPEDSRIFVSTLVGISMSTGIAGGQLLAGIIGPISSWRLPFLLVSIPALLLGILILLTASEPKRGSQEEGLRVVTEIMSDHPIITLTSNYYQLDQPITQQMSTSMPTHSNDARNSSNPILTFSNESPSQTIESTSKYSNSNYCIDINSRTSAHNKELEYDEKIDLQKLSTLFTTPSALIIFLQGLPGCIPWGMIYVFLNDYFSSDRGMTVQQSTVTLFLFGFGGLFGQIFGGWFGQYLYSVDKRLQCVLMGMSTLAAILPMLYLINTNNEADFSFYVVAFIAGLLISINGPNIRSILQNVCSPEVRGTAFAVFMLTDDLGKGFGPVIVVQLLQTCQGNRQTTYNIAVLFWIICGSLLLLLVFTVVQDEFNVQEKIMEALQNQRYRSNQTSMIIDPDLSPSTVYDASILVGHSKSMNKNVESKSCSQPCDKECINNIDECTTSVCSMNERIYNTECIDLYPYSSNPMNNNINVQAIGKEIHQPLMDHGICNSNPSVPILTNNLKS